jgi:accessory gene regulator protein AgrB
MNWHRRKKSPLAKTLEYWTRQAKRAIILAIVIIILLVIIFVAAKYLPQLFHWAFG